jgi:hypothetical protein
MAGTARRLGMPWYDYLLGFFGGAFLCNAVPHLTRGLSGSAFPTPFASPPGRGLSPPLLNVLWGAANLAAAYVLLRYGQFSLGSWTRVLVAFAGALLIGLQLAITFARASKPA